MCFGSHRILDATIDACRANGIKAGDIAAVDVELAENSTKVLRNHRPQTSLEAKFSAEFAIASAAIAGRCSDAEVSDAFVRRRDVQDFFSKVRVHPITEKDPEEPTRSPYDRVKLTLVDGRKISSEDVKYPRGHFKRGVEREVLWQKFSDCATASVSPDRARALFEAFQNMPRLTSLNDVRATLAAAE
jgi:2-methylcitrate dehydratase PrpD